MEIGLVELIDLCHDFQLEAQSAGNPDGLNRIFFRRDAAEKGEITSPWIVLGMMQVKG